MAPAPRTTPTRTPVSASTLTVKSTSTNSPPPSQPPFSGPPASPSQTPPEKPSLPSYKRPAPQARLSATVLANSRTSPSLTPLRLTASTSLLRPSIPRSPVLILVPLLPAVSPLLHRLSPGSPAPTAAATTITTHSPPLSIRPPPRPRSLKTAAQFRTSTPRASESSPLPFFAALCSSKSPPSRASVRVWFSPYSSYPANFIEPSVQINVRHTLRSDDLLSSPHHHHRSLSLLLMSLIFHCFWGEQPCCRLLEE